MKKTLLFAVVALFLVSCETTGNKRQNGTNTEHINAKLKNITVHGALTIGGGKQDTKGASQEGLGRVQADAKVEDTLNGQDDLVKAVVVPKQAPLPPAPANKLDAPAKPLTLED